MKKIFVLVAVTIMAVVSVNAQSGYEDTTHEIGLRYKFWKPAKMKGWKRKADRLARFFLFDVFSKIS